MKKYILQSASVKRAKLKARAIFFSHLKVTDTKEDEQRTMSVCIGWELLEVIC